jgi:hypothetical protein
VKRGLILPDAPLMQGLLAAARGRGKQSPRAAGAKYAVAFRHARRRQLHGVNSNAMYIYLFALAALCYAVSACLPSAVLAAVIGANPAPRTEITKKVWDYIKKFKLQNAANKRMIDADDKLKAVFGGKKQVSMFEMTKLISGHLK